jgi:hypothetical protein
MLREFDLFAKLQNISRQAVIKTLLHQALDHRHGVHAARIKSR